MIEQEDEILSLQIERSGAKEKMKETYSTLQSLRSQVSIWEKDYLKWSKRFSEADRALAEIDGRMKKVTARSTKLPTNVVLALTRDQVIEIAAKLGAEIKFEDEEEEE